MSYLLLSQGNCLVKTDETLRQFEREPYSCLEPDSTHQYCLLICCTTILVQLTSDYNALLIDHYAVRRHVEAPPILFILFYYFSSDNVVVRILYAQ